MSFSAQTQFVPGDPKGMQVWALTHYLEHQIFYNTLLSQGTVTINYPLQMIENMDEWLAWHDEEHQSVWKGVGGGQATDLQRVDWKNTNNLLDWFQIHAQVHYQIRQSLGL